MNTFSRNLWTDVQPVARLIDINVDRVMFYGSTISTRPQLAVTHSTLYRCMAINTEGLLMISNSVKVQIPCKFMLL